MMRTMAMLALLCVALATMAAALPPVTAALPAAAPALRTLRDPFVRPAPPPPAPAAALPAEPAPEPPPLHLRAVILNGARSVANIDGDIVGAGDQARDYTVVRIDAHGVLVTRAGKRQLLTMTEKDKQ
ncbi:hypothetical protein [Herbaspirillum sp. SJZ107]|uniref:hypothetical protein n=1 Tax=Herbaspirillum sp. SJZ107 TaxID=2572881 RepID=UPI001152EAA4|nr:hypothetical protein [Herbaspirillum sp. SJZ107]TQK05554.1 hypothetical protein FBX97_4531 [Herbaspirillum sp. SJZ107]